MIKPGWRIKCVLLIWGLALVTWLVAQFWFGIDLWVRLGFCIPFCGFTWMGIVLYPLFIGLVIRATEWDGTVPGTAWDR